MSTNDSQNFRLLVCSSNLNNLDPLCRRLQANDVDTDRATHAAQVREKLWQEHYDGVVIDLLLADRDGISFAMELRDEHPWVSLMVLSSACSDDDRRTGPDWLNYSSDHARLVFALKQASQRSAGRTPNILHVEADDRLAGLVKKTIGRQTNLFRARNTQEAKIALAIREYDLALIRTPRNDLDTSAAASRGSGLLTINTDRGADPILALLQHLQRSPYTHQPAYC